MKKTGFRYHEAPPKGFQVTFENGWTLSIQWGLLHHCEAQGKYAGGIFGTPVNIESANAEVAVLDQDGTLTALGGSDTVMGYLSPDQVLTLANVVAKLPSEARAADIDEAVEGEQTRLQESWKKNILEPQGVMQKLLSSARAELPKEPDEE